MKKFLFTVLFIITSFQLFSLEVTLTQGTIKPTPIAVTNFFSNENSANNIGKNISNIISDNLERSGLFMPINKKHSFKMKNLYQFNLVLKIGK